MYSKTHWQDRVVDPETGEVVQEGTFMSAEHFNNMEDGIEANDTAISEISESVETIETTLDTGVGTTITLTVNSSTFVMKLALKNSEGDILSESEVDLPIESMIVNAEYVEATKSLVLTLQSGSKVTVPLSALINGLVNDTRKVAGMDLKKDITVAEMVTALGVDKKANKTSVSSANKTTSTIAITDNSQMVMVAKISGKTVKDGTTLKSAAVESVVSTDKSGNKTTVLAPSEARNCEGYGLGISDSVCNIADFENGVYTQNVIEIDLGDLNWFNDTTTSNVFNYGLSDRKVGALVGICSKYNIYSGARGGDQPDKTICAYNLSNAGISIKDSAYTDASKLKSDLKGVKLIYQLASPVTTPISDFIRPLPVEQGGTLTLVNQHNLDVNSVIKYKKEV